MPRRHEKLVPLLLELEEDLDQEISLTTLAARFGSSAFHFHRTFSDSIGETPKKHVTRLRLEKAASLLAVSDQRIVDISLAVGFKNPETFSRDFKKFIGYSPSGYRRMAKAAQADRVRNVDFHGHDAYFLSRAKFVTLPAMQLLALRHMGDYGALNESFGDESNAWTKLIDWARAAGIRAEPPLVGLFYDDPTLTPEPQRRADVCVRVRAACAGTQTIRCIELEGGAWAVCEYVGRIDTILSAFRGLADEIRRSRRYTFRDAPALEFLRTPNVGGRAGVHQIDVCFGVVDKRKLA
jgi:AraC family transcriptional regulator